MEYQFHEDKTESPCGHNYETSPMVVRPLKWMERPFATSWSATAVILAGAVFLGAAVYLGGAKATGARR